MSEKQTSEEEASDGAVLNENGGRYAVTNTRPTSFQDEGMLIVFAAIVPFALVMLPISAVFGQWVWSFAPLTFVIGIIAFRCWRMYRTSMASDDPLEVQGHGSFTGEAKRVLTRNAMLMLFASTLALLLVTAYGHDIVDWVVEAVG